MDEFGYSEIRERNNVWLANMIRGLTEPGYYLYLLGIGMIKKSDIEDFITDSIKDCTELFFKLKCHVCDRTDGKCMDCFCKFIAKDESEE